MHPEVSNFIESVKQKHPTYFKDQKVLEVGSLNINGTIRSLFKDCNYLGIDIGEGPGVDMVIPIHELSWPFTFDVVVSTEMLEHDIHWKSSLESMYNNLKHGGLLILTCAGPARQEHGTTRTTPGDSPFTNEYYRNIDIDDFISILPANLFSESAINLVRANTDLVFYGIKK